MYGGSSFVMAAVMVMVVSLAIVLGLVLFLLAELYCSLLFSRSKNRNKRDVPAIESSERSQNAPSLSSFYAQGVLRAPRNFLFPDENKVTDLEKQIPESPFSNTLRSPGMRARDYEDQLIYICNPIFDNEAGNLTGKVDSNDITPFETPDTSPSRLDTCNSDDSAMSSPSMVVVETPPLTPMKRLDVPADTSSLSLRDARSICSMGSESNSNNGGVSSSIGSTRSSPSW